MSCLFLSLTTYRLNIIVSTTQTLSEIKSQEIIGHIKQHFMTTSPLTYVTNDIQDFVKILYKSWVHLDLRADNMLYGGLHPPAPHVTTYEPTTCYLVDYILQHRMLQPRADNMLFGRLHPPAPHVTTKSRQHAIWWTTSSSTACYNLRADNMLFGGLHAPAPHVTTYEPTTCYMVDYILQHRMLQPRADNMLFGGLHPPAPHVTTYEPTTCYLVDYMLQHRMLQPTSRQHAIWWTTSSSTACYNL